MTTDDMIKDKKLKFDINREKYPHYHPEKLVNTNILQAKKSCNMIKVEQKNFVKLSKQNIKAEIYQSRIIEVYIFSSRQSI